MVSKILHCASGVSVVCAKKRHTYTHTHRHVSNRLDIDILAIDVLLICFRSSSAIATQPHFWIFRLGDSAIDF